MTEASTIERYHCATDLIRDGGALAHSYFRKRHTLTINQKGLQDMVSEADLNTEKLIRERLRREFPSDAFLGEETGMSECAPDQGVWVVDPIDGTQPFISGMSGWCVSIAFVRNRVLEFGLVFAPERAELFAGGAGIPATLNGHPVEKHPGRSIQDGIVGVGYSPRVTPERFLSVFSPLLRGGAMFYREGSGALTLCYVACGRLVGYIEAHINSWDCLGAVAVIRAAGLRTNDFLAGDGLRSGGYLIAGNEHVFPELEAIYQKGISDA